MAQRGISTGAAIGSMTGTGFFFGTVRFVAGFFGANVFATVFLAVVATVCLGAVCLGAGFLVAGS